MENTRDNGKRGRANYEWMKTILLRVKRRRGKANATVKRVLKVKRARPRPLSPKATPLASLTRLGSSLRDSTSLAIP